MKKTCALLFFGILIPMLQTGCGTFQRSYRQALAEYAAGETEGPEGPWEGTWITTTNGHEGTLKAVVTKEPGESDIYEFHYFATWARFFRGGYRVKYPVTRTSSGYRVVGTENLGFFGEFTHDGTIVGDRFSATYEKGEGEQVGSFEMSRPPR